MVGSDVVAHASSYQAEPRPYHPLDPFIFRRARRAPSAAQGAAGITGRVLASAAPHLEDISSTRIRENVDLNRDISTSLTR